MCEQCLFVGNNGFALASRHIITLHVGDQNNASTFVNKGWTYFLEHISERGYVFSHEMESWMERAGHHLAPRDSEIFLSINV